MSYAHVANAYLSNLTEEANHGGQVAAEIGVYFGLDIQVPEADLCAGVPDAHPAR